MVKTSKIIFLENPLGTAKGIFCFKRAVFLALFILYISSSFGQAKCEIKETKKNFGYLKRGKVVEIEYELNNTGNQPLLITDVEVSCSCSQFEFSKQPILPGQKAILILKFNTTSVYGRQDRIAYIISNDPKGRTKIRYKGTVSNN